MIKKRKDYLLYKEEWALPVLLIMFFLCSYFALIPFICDNGQNSLLGFILSVIIVSTIPGLLAIECLMCSIKLIISHNTNMEITDKGIFFYQFGFIPWFEILDIYLSDKENEPKYITIKINNARKYLRNASVSYRLFAFFKKDESDELIFREAFTEFSRIYKFATSMYEKYHQF